MVISFFTEIIEKTFWEEKELFIVVFCSLNTLTHILYGSLEVTFSYLWQTKMVLQFFSHSSLWGKKRNCWVFLPTLSTQSLLIFYCPCKLHSKWCRVVGGEVRVYTASATAIYQRTKIKKKKKQLILKYISTKELCFLQPGWKSPEETGWMKYVFSWMQTEALAFPVFPIGTAKTEEEEYIKLCTKRYAKIQEISGNTMEVRDLKKSEKFCISLVCKCKLSNCLKVLFMKFDTLFSVMELYEWYHSYFLVCLPDSPRLKTVLIPVIRTVKEVVFFFQ